MSVLRVKGKYCSSIVALGGVLCATVASADTVLFPVIATNSPSVTTIVTVLNRIGSSSSHLHYTYRHKAALVGGVPNLTGTCSTVQFTRPTSAGDLVSFDPSGTLNSGNAMFGDTNDYGGGFGLGLSGARRAYLLVSHSDAVGTRQDVGNAQNLSGEAVVMDIATGAAWGMKGINDNTREDYTFVNHDDGGGVWSALPSNGFDDRRLMFFPPSEWTTRMFVTPIGTNMHSANLPTTVALESSTGVVDRQGTLFTFTPINLDVTCTGAVDLEDLFDSTVWAAIENVGGWSWFAVKAGDAVVYKLEFVVNDPTYGGTVNNGYLLSSYAQP